jgi:hypothetical protein
VLQCPPPPKLNSPRTNEQDNQEEESDLDVFPACVTCGSRMATESDVQDLHETKESDVHVCMVCNSPCHPHCSIQRWDQTTALTIFSQECLIDYKLGKRIII